MTYIYVLKEPLTKNVRYVGKTTNPKDILIALKDIGHCYIGKEILRFLRYLEDITVLNYQDAILSGRQKTALIFPLQGAWHLTQGGAEAVKNNHWYDPAQRYAIDITKINRFTGSECEKSCNKNGDFYAFGFPVYAPASGVVVDLEARVKDNKIVGEFDTWGLGNAIILKHSTGEFSVFAHLKYGSVNVKIGDKIKQGTRLGQVGNTGRSTGPHLHYNLQTTADPYDTISIRAWFKNLWVIENGEYVKRHTYAPSGGENIYRSKR